MRRELMIAVCVLLAMGTVTPLLAQLPVGWTSAGIGNPAVAGSARYDQATQTWTIQGDGTGLRGTADQFHYVYKTLNGDGELAARVVSLDPPLSDWSMAGVMIRVLLIPGSPSIFMGISANTAGGSHALTMWGRGAVNGAAGDESTGTETPPHWVKIKRAGDTFSGYSSANGKDWIQRYTTNAAGIPNSIYIGYAVTSDVGGKLVTAVFDQGPRQASNPDPADGKRDVPLALLRWTAGVTAAFHNVYLGTDPILGPADYQGQLPAFATMYFHAPGLTGGTTYYWRVDEVEADGKTIHPGDVWTFTAQALVAYLPGPPDGTTNASVRPTLTWQPGQSAAKHHVYFSSEREAVAQGGPGADRGIITEAAFAPGALDSVATYYWRVDEIVSDGTVRPGPVWSFTTCLPIEDFEGYADDEGNRIYQTWLDGETNKTGAVVGYPQAPFAEQTIVHGGRQSLPLDYNNVKSPWYSETERQWSTPQDWTAKGVNTLVLYVRGAAANAPAPFYVAVEDRTGRVAVVTHPNSNLVTTMRWTEWRIPLADLTGAGINVTAVKKLYLGVGNRSKPTAGGAGRIYVDDIRVIKSAP
ncbi:MAG: hypothetical protein FJ280_19960 [Planctomycetes bacterium]|nr:hypothetical protein [Planctomycetota bacterium]